MVMNFSVLYWKIASQGQEFTYALGNAQIPCECFKIQNCGGHDDYHIRVIEKHSASVQSWSKRTNSYRVLVICPCNPLIQCIRIYESCQTEKHFASRGDPLGRSNPVIRRWVVYLLLLLDKIVNHFADD